MNWFIISIASIILILLGIYIYFIKFREQFPYDPTMNNCLYNRWGCCKDGLTPKLDIFGSNCRGF